MHLAPYHRLATDPVHYALNTWSWKSEWGERKWRNSNPWRNTNTHSEKQESGRLWSLWWSAPSLPEAQLYTAKKAGTSCSWWEISVGEHSQIQEEELQSNLSVLNFLVLTNSLSKLMLGSENCIDISLWLTHGRCNLFHASRDQDPWYGHPCVTSTPPFRTSSTLQRPGTCVFELLPLFFTVENVLIRKKILFYAYCF